MNLTGHLRRQAGDFVLDADLDVPSGCSVALAGPSGAGKTTALRLLAGVDALDSGRVAWGAEVWDDPAAGRFVPPDRRGVGWMPQGGALFPHLDAAGNVAFALRRRGFGRRRARAEAEEWLERVGLVGRAGARAHELSGGESRRVALARALAGAPRVLLLDEPFAGLDPGARATLRGVVRRALAAGPEVRILVAHEPSDALALVEWVVVLERGRVVQQGTPAELCERPRTPYVATLGGLNVVRGRARQVQGLPVLEADEGGGTLQVAEAVEGPVLATFKPSAVALSKRGPRSAAERDAQAASMSPRNVLEGVVAELAPSGERVRVRVDSEPPVIAELTTAAAEALELRVGDRVWASVKATEIEVLPDD